MDPSADSDDRLLRSTRPQQRLAQALEMMQEGLSWKRAAIARAHPGASPEQLERLLVQWLLADD